MAKILFFLMTALFLTSLAANPLREMQLDLGLGPSPTESDHLTTQSMVPVKQLQASGIQLVLLLSQIARQEEFLSIEQHSFLRAVAIHHSSQLTRQYAQLLLRYQPHPLRGRLFRLIEEAATQDLASLPEAKGKQQLVKLWFRMWADIAGTRRGALLGFASGLPFGFTERAYSHLMPEGRWYSPEVEAIHMNLGIQLLEMAYFLTLEDEFYSAPRARLEFATVARLFKLEDRRGLINPNSADWLDFVGTNITSRIGEMGSVERKFLIGSGYAQGFLASRQLRDGLDVQSKVAYFRKRLLRAQGDREMLMKFRDNLIDQMKLNSNERVLIRGALDQLALDRDINVQLGAEIVAGGIWWTKSSDLPCEALLKDE